MSARSRDTIAWHSVAAAGISFAYIRAADGDGSGDQQFANNWHGATGAGVTPGAYLFFEPSESPVAQANVLISQLRSVGFSHGDLMPAIDVETMGGEPQSVVIANLKTVVDTVSAAIGSLPAIYASPSWWNGNINSSAFTLDPLWVANWFVSHAAACRRTTGVAPAGRSGSSAMPAPCRGSPGRVDLDQGGTRSLPYYGWPDPVALPATNVAGTTADRLGSIRRHRCAVARDERPRLDTWIPQRRVGDGATDISAAAGRLGRADDRPIGGVVGPGRIDAFWEGADGERVAVDVTAAVVRQRQWSAPVSLGLGPVGSVPEAVSPGPGLIDLVLGRRRLGPLGRSVQRHLERRDAA